MHSDYDLAQTLKAAAKQQTSTRALPDFVEASRSVKSDYDQRRVLQQAIARPALTPAVASAMFKAATPAAGDSGHRLGLRHGGAARRTPPVAGRSAGSGMGGSRRGSIGSAYDRTAPSLPC